MIREWAMVTDLPEWPEWVDHTNTSHADRDSEFNYHDGFWTSYEGRVFLYVKYEKILRYRQALITEQELDDWNNIQRKDIYNTMTWTHIPVPSSYSPYNFEVPSLLMMEYL